MAMETHLDELLARHRSLEGLISDELSRPYADALRLSELKKQKLMVKDEIEKVRAASAAVH